MTEPSLDADGEVFILNRLTNGCLRISPDRSTSGIIYASADTKFNASRQGSLGIATGAEEVNTLMISITNNRPTPIRTGKTALEEPCYIPLTMGPDLTR